MTRITNFGRKRTYLEAGFTEPEPKHSRNATNSEPIPTSQRAASPTSDAEPSHGREPSNSLLLDAQYRGSEEAVEKRKHRKRHRSKKGKGPLGMSQVLAGKRDETGTAGSGSNAAGPSQPKRKKQKLERPRSDERRNGRGVARKDGPGESNNRGPSQQTVSHIFPSRPERRT